MEKKKEWLKTVLPIWAFILFAEVVAIRSYIGPLPSWKKVLLACLVPYVLIGLITLNQKIQNWVQKLELLIGTAIKEFIVRERNWKKAGIVVGIDLVISVFAERILTFIADGSWGADFNFRKAIWGFAIVFLISLFLCYKSYFIYKIEVIVLLVILSVGGVYATALPVSCGISWDDEAHFHNVIRMAHILHGRMTLGDADILNSFVDTALEHNIYNEEAHTAWIEQIDANEASGGYGPDGRNLPSLESGCYIPAAFGWVMGYTLGLPYHLIFILGRWCNLLTYALLIYFAIRRIKSGKMLLSVIALLPPCILMAASYSRDSWMIGFIFLGFATFVGEIQTPEKKLKIWDMILMIGAFVVGVGPKAIYVPILLVCLFMPKDKFVSKKACMIFRGSVILATLVVLSTFMVPFIVSSGGAVEDTRGGSDVNASLQTAYILSQPLAYTKTLLLFLKEYVSLDAAKTYLTYMHYFGTGGFATLQIALMVVVTLTDHEKCNRYLTWKPRAATFVLSFGVVCLAATAMYIAYTPVKADTILGCQYRYLLQIMFPSLFMIGSFPLENKIPKYWYRGIILAVSAFILLSAVWTLLIRTF